VASHVRCNALPMMPRGYARAIFLALLALQMRDVGALHDDAPTCPPAAMELACSPSAEIVTPDGTPVGKEFRACAPRYCTQMPHVEHGTVTAIKTTNVDSRAAVASGDAVRITCDTGYELSGAQGRSAQPKCVDGCTFEQHEVCVPKKCMQPFQDPNGVVVGGPIDDLATRNYLEFDEYVRITCNHGYMASDTSHSSHEVCKISYVRECLSDGTLLHAGKKCIPLTCAPIGDDDASLKYNSSGELLKVASYQPPGAHGYKTRVNLTCDEGYYLAGGTPQRECSWTCQYTSAAAHCRPLSCNVTATPPNTHWLGDEPEMWSETGTLRCDNAHVLDLETCGTSQDLTCGAVADGVAVLDKEMRSCVPAVCKPFQVANSDKAVASASDARNYSETVEVTCNAGFRAVAVNSSDPIPPYVACAAPGTFLATCGVGTIHNDTYAPCTFDFPLQCRKTMCEVRRLDNGVNSPAPAGAFHAIAGKHYLENGATLTQTCNEGYAMPRTYSGSGNALLYAFADDVLWYDKDEYDEGTPPVSITTHTISCQGTCELNHKSAVCRPILCGHYTVPEGTTARFRKYGAGAGNHSMAGEVIRNISYSDTVTVTCDHGTVLSGSDACGRDHVVTCGADGEFVNLVAITCVPAECPISEMYLENAVGTPGSGTVEHGVKANVSCSGFYRVRDMAIHLAGTCLAVCVYVSLALSHSFAVSLVPTRSRPALPHIGMLAHRQGLECWVTHLTVLL
jgi:hypothetical protein